jgi:hypothetical protein
VIDSGYISAERPADGSLEAGAPVAQVTLTLASNPDPFELVTLVAVAFIPSSRSWRSALIAFELTERSNGDFA